MRVTHWFITDGLYESELRDLAKLAEGLVAKMNARQRVTLPPGVSYEREDDEDGADVEAIAFISRVDWDRREKAAQDEYNAQGCAILVGGVVVLLALLAIGAAHRFLGWTL